MDRKVAQAEVRKLGADTPSSVVADLTYLVIGVERDGQKSSKQKSAEKLNAKGAAIQVLDEKQFLAVLDAARRGPPARG
jgi:NAD-dependent DNA ligase